MLICSSLIICSIPPKITHIPIVSKMCPLTRKERERECVKEREEANLYWNRMVAVKTITKKLMSNLSQASLPLHRFPKQQVIFVAPVASQELLEKHPFTGWLASGPKFDRAGTEKKIKHFFIFADIFCQKRYKCRKCSYLLYNVVLILKKE